MHILYAEDSRAIARHVIAHLQALGHQVTHVANGRAAVEAYRLLPPDLVLMDVVMPELSGIEATREIKAMGGSRWVPLMIMTGLDSPQEMVAGLEAGADEYLIKPINFRVLEARINSLQRVAVIQDCLYGIFDNVFEGIVTIDGKGVITAFNKAAERIFGYAAAEVVGEKVNLLMPSPYREEHDAYLERYHREGTPHIIGFGRRVIACRKNGEHFPVMLAVTEVANANGHQYIGLLRDISAEEAAREQIEFLALHDALTGLPNRAQLNREIEQVLAAEKPAASLLFIDLDGFKPINDQLGHEAGDQALVTVAARLRHALAETHFVGRLGGDEFVILLQGVNDAEGALAAAQQAIAAISEPMDLLDPPRQRVLGASIGIALIPRHGRSRTELLTIADDAMYIAKRAGKRRAVLADDDRCPH